MTMVNAACGANPSLQVGPLAHQVLKKGFERGGQYDAGETLAACNGDLDFLSPHKSHGGIEIPQ